MADEPDAPTGEASAEHPDQPADADTLAARLAEVHRRTEELAAQVASFQAGSGQTGDGAVTDEASGQGDARPRPRPRPTPQAEQPPSEAPTEAEAPADAPAERPRPRPRPTTAPGSGDSGSAAGAAPAAAAGAAATASAAAPAEAAATPDTKAEPESPPEAKPEAKPESTPDPEAATQETTQDEKPKRFQRKKKSESEDGDKADKPDKNQDKEKNKKDNEKEKRPSKGLPNWVRRIRSLVIVVVVVVGVALLLRAFVATPYYVPSASMEPTLHGCPNCNDDHVLVQKLSYDFHDPERTDIVVFDNPGGRWSQVKEGTLIKRVIGVPGDKIVIKNGHVFINGSKLDESYVNKKCHGTGTNGHGASFGKVPKGKLFVMGDNRCDSEDSRSFGTIPIDNVVGKALLIYYPFGRFGSL